MNPLLRPFAWVWDTTLDLLAFALTCVGLAFINVVDWCFGVVRDMEEKR